MKAEVHETGKPVTHMQAVAALLQVRFLLGQQPLFIRSGQAAAERRKGRKYE